MVAVSRSERVRAAHAELVRAQKPRRGQAYSVLVNRPLGRWLAAFACVVGLRPNQVTAISASITAAAIALLALGDATVATGIVVSVLLAAGYAADAADGQLARLRGGSTLGEFLDHVLDAAKHPALHIAVAVFLHRSGDVSAPVLLVPLGFVIVSVVSFSSMLLRDLLSRSTGRSGDGRPAGPASSASMMLRLPVDYGSLCWSFVLVGWIDVFVVVYCLLFAARAAHVVVAFPGWFRQMRVLD